MPISSAATRVAALLSGEIDFTNVAPLQDLQRLAASPEVKVLQTNELRTVIFAFNLKDKLFESDVTDKNPLRDIRVREALYRAIDIDAVQRRAMRGLSRNTGAIVAPAIPGYTKEQDERLPFDLDGSKKLLAAAGYPNGFSFNFNCQSDGLVNEEEFCQAVAAMWSRAGLKPNLSLGPRSTQTPKRVKGDFDIISFGWANEPMIDAYSILMQVMRSKSGTGGVFNWGNWGRPDIDALIDKAGVELDTVQADPDDGGSADDRKARASVHPDAQPADGLGRAQHGRGDSAGVRQQAAALADADALITAFRQADGEGGEGDAA